MDIFWFYYQEFLIISYWLLYCHSGRLNPESRRQVVVESSHPALAKAGLGGFPLTG